MTIGAATFGYEKAIYAYPAMTKTETKIKTETKTKTETSEETEAITDAEGFERAIMDAARQGDAPEAFAGMSFMDLIASGKGNNTAIPVVDRIVTAQNPEDGKIYTTCFTDRRITCLNGEGGQQWSMKITDQEQADKIREFFENYNSDLGISCQIYSDQDMGVVSSKDFWMELFEN